MAKVVLKKFEARLEPTFIRGMPPSSQAEEERTPARTRRIEEFRSEPEPVVRVRRTEEVPEQPEAEEAPEEDVPEEKTPERGPAVRRLLFGRKKKEAAPEQPGMIMSGLARMGRSLGIRKPVFADCWSVGTGEDLRILEKYEMPGGSVTIGLADDGEIEYNLVPKEYSYSPELTAVIGEAVDRVREDYRKNGGRMDRQSVLMRAREAICRNWPENDDVNWNLDDLCQAVYRYVLGLGVFDLLLSDDRIEDIYVDAPCDRNRIHITMNRVEGFVSHIRCRTNLIAENREVRNLISRLKKETGLPYCESSPVLETDMDDGNARATVVGYPMSPNGDSVAIRKHSADPWTLTKLIGNGTMDRETAGLLSFLVDNRSSFMVCGARGAGKSSLLSAMMFEFPLAQRILTIEDTMELPARQMRGLGYKVQTMLIDDRMNGDARSRADDALRVSLRLGESAIILGEVRGEEATTLYQSMRTGKAGSSIMGTMHGDSARSVYERVVHDMGISPEAFMATDFLVTLGMVKERGGVLQNRAVTEFVCTTGVPGEFKDIRKGDALMSSPAMTRIMSSCGLTEQDVRDEIRMRTEMRGFLADAAAQYGDSFYGPEWIIMANDHLSKQLSAGCTDCDEIVGSFKRRVLQKAGVA